MVVRMTSKLCKGWLIAAVFGAAGVLALVGCGRTDALGPPQDETAGMAIREKLLSAKTPSGGASESSGEQASAKKFDGWASLKGRFVVDGAAPSLPPIRATKDQAVCGAHPLPNESIVVAGDKGLANVVVFLRTPKAPINDEYKKSASDKILLDNHNCRFEPHVLGIRVGQTLQVRNSDPVAHNTKISGESLQFNQLIAVGTSLELPIDSAESQPAVVACSIHDWMSGRLLIRPDPYFAISDSSGKFEIRDLPAGQLEFQVWQESIGGVGLNQPDLNWDSKGRFTVTLHNGEEKDLKDISVPVALFQGR